MSTHLDKFVEERVYRSASEVVREGLRLLEIRENQIAETQAVLDEGRSSALIDGKESMSRIRQRLKDQHGV